MKSFRASPPNFAGPAVAPLRTKNVAGALAALAPPFTNDVAAELIALAFVHEDADVRKRAMALATKHIPDTPKFKAAYKSLAGQAQHVVSERIRSFEHPYRLDISRAALFHRLMAGSLPFEQDHRARGVMLDVMIANAQRERETVVDLGEVFWYWEKGSGWATFLENQVLPNTLFRELTSRRKTFAFTGIRLTGSFTHIPEELAEAAPWLESLAIHGSFAQVPPVLWKLKNLKSLFLTGTDLVDIPEEIASLPKLRRLDIGNMWKMKSVPRSVCKLDKLEYLRIGNGSITTIPKDITAMTSLKEFDLQSSRVRKLPKGISAMPKLKKVNVRWTRVSQSQIDELKAAKISVE